MSLDEQLLAQKKDEEKSAQRAGDLRTAQKATSQKATSGNSRAGGPGNFKKDEDVPPASLREAVIAKNRNARAKAEKEGSGDKITSAVAAPMRKGTSSMLRQAWLNLIPSWGCSLFWINIHVFLGAIFGNKFFCKLGGEWVDDNIKTAQADYARSQGKIIGSTESVGLAGCDLGCLFIIIALACLIAMIVGAITNPLEAIGSLLKAIWDSFIGKSD